MIVKVLLYICPTEGCGNYYGSSAMGNMENIQTDSHMRATFPRKRCPDCHIRGRDVMREPVMINVEV